MSHAKFPEIGYGKPVGAVRLAHFAATCGWEASIGPVRRVSDQNVIRLTMTRGEWPNPGSWELQMNWAAEQGKATFERRHTLFGRRDGGPWAEMGKIIKDAMAIMDQHRSARRVTLPSPRKGESPGSLRRMKNR